jgi:hypothetical protein
METCARTVIKEVQPELLLGVLRRERECIVRFTRLLKAHSYQLCSM